MDAKVRKWPKKRRFAEGVRLIMDEGETQRKAAERMGVSRAQLLVHLKAAKEEREEKVEKARAQAAEVVQGGVVVSNERRLIGSFQEWEQRYFGHMMCPDCDKRHAEPDFHREIVEALESDSRRTVINIPPYHAKSTLVTVKHTLYEICRNPNLRTAIVSKSAPMARTFLKAIAEMLSNEDLYIGAGGNLIEDFGPFRKDGKDQVWSASQLYVAGRTTMEKDPTVRAMGVGEQIYGARFDRIKFDDIAVVENQKNPDRVQDMLGWIDKEALSRIGKSGKAIWVGTRVMPGDIYSFLKQRSSYDVIQYPLIVDDTSEETLWPDHFPYSQALIHRDEMKPADFQLVYQNVDVPGLGASFTQEMLEECKDTSRVLGHYDPEWRLIAGLDPAGGNRDSGYTAMSVVGVDLRTGARYLVDQMAMKSMKAPEMKGQILDWSDRYPLAEWRVEVNGVQSQIIQYDRELVRELAQRGVRVIPHTTHRNKWDATFGVESMAPLFEQKMISIPWGNRPTAQALQPFIEELIGFPMAKTSDRVMSFWFTHIGAKDMLDRPHLPMFDERMRVPARIKRKRRVVDFENSRVQGVSPRDQTGRAVHRKGSLARRMNGRPGEQPITRPETDSEYPAKPAKFNRIWGE